MRANNAWTKMLSLWLRLLRYQVLLAQLDSGQHDYCDAPTNLHTISNCSTGGCCGICGIGVGFGFLSADSDNLATEVETMDPRPFKFEHQFVGTPTSLRVNSYM